MRLIRILLMGAMTVFRLAALPLTLILLWSGLSAAGILNDYLLPPPWRVLAAARDLAGSGELARHVGASLHRVASGFVVAALIALPLAVALHASRSAEAYLRPLLEFLRATPPLAMIPLVILWFGIGETSKLVVIVLASFFPIFLNVLGGLRQTDARYIELARTLDLGTWERIRFVFYPSALPAAVTGLRLGFGFCWRALIGAEIIAAPAGLGYLIVDAQELARTDRAFVGILVIGTLGYLFDAVFMRAARRLTPWTTAAAG